MGNIKTDLVAVQGNLNAQRYVNLLNNNLLPFMQNFGFNTTTPDPILPLSLQTSGTKQRERFSLAGFIPEYESYRAHLG